MAYVRASQPTYTSQSLGGAPYNGFSPEQTIGNYNSSANVMARRVLTRSWNGQAATGVWNGYARVVTPFRAVTGNGDFLARENYACNVPNPYSKTRSGFNIGKGNLGSVPNKCDNTGVPSESCNPRFVADSSDYVTYRKLRAMNQNYNDLKRGGDQNNGSYVARMRVVHGNREVAP